jgi:DNA-binding MarR family transcriptional regulator
MTDEKRSTPKKLQDFVPYQLHVVANRLSTGASRIYRRRYGITVSERQFMMIFATEPGATANRACHLVGIDRALASRIINSLVRRRLLRTATERSDKRLRAIYLTEKGWKLHEAMQLVGQERARRLLQSFSRSERALLFSYLKRLDENVEGVNAYDPGPNKRRVKS